MGTRMNRTKKSALIAGIFIIGILLSLVVCGCIEPDVETGNASNNSLQNTTPNINAMPTAATEPANITLKVVKFEPARPCYSCTLLGNYANETIKLYFQEEYQSGKISYETVNYQDPNNIDVVRKYGISGSSLYITVITDSNEEIINANDMWSYVGNKEEYMNVFKNKLDDIVKGYENV